MATRDSTILRALFDRAPEAAVEYIRGKGINITWNWQEMRDEAHARSFTVAKAARLDIVQDIRRGVLDAVREGKTLRQFSEELTPLLQRKGWWGKQLDLDGSEIQLGSPRRLKTIYRTNLQSAYMAGRAQTALEADAFPYLQYVAIEDDRTRPAHLALNGQVFRKDDPIWHTHTPPNGFNCRCRVRPMTAGQVQREGLDVRSSEGQTQTRTVDIGTNDDTGEIYRTEQTGIRVTGANGRARTMWADPGFNSSPLAGHNFDALLMRKAREALGDARAHAVVERIVTAVPRLRAWRGFVANSFARDMAQGQTMTVGVIPRAVVTNLEADRAERVAVIHLADRLIVGRKARRHARRGDALTREQWESLPTLMPRATWYRDQDSGNLVAGLPGNIYMMIAPDGGVDSTYRDAAARRKIRDGRWQPV